MKETSTSGALDEFVAAFENAQARLGTAALEEFLPHRDHPLYPRVLRELVRVDLEYRWARGQACGLEDYRSRFPELFASTEAVAEIAYEEYRQRRQSGEAVLPEEYHWRYGIDTTAWPRMDTRQIEGRPSAPISPSSPRAIESDSWADSRPNGRPADLVGALRASDPEMAFLLAQTLTALPEVGDELLGFRLVAELGRGAFGRVYLAEQGDLANRLVALKIAVDAPGEPQTLAQLQHTNIVPVYSTHRAGMFQAVCMPYFGPTTFADVLSILRSRPAMPASGRDLVRALRERGRSFPPPPGGETTTALTRLENLPYVTAVLSLAQGMAEGLAHAHEHGIIHQDLKPANVLLTAEGRPMLLDFNLSTDTKRAASVAQVGGTLPYMAPEQLEVFCGRPAQIGPRTDLYALGVILYELLTGRLPFGVPEGPVGQGLEQMIAERRRGAGPVRKLNPAVTPAVESLVRHLLEPDAARRYPGALELREDLARQLSSRPLRYAPDRSPRERLGKWARRHPRLASPWTASAAALVLTAGMLAPTAWDRYHKAQGDLQTTRAALSEATAKVSQAEEELKTARKAASERLDQFRTALRSARALADETRMMQGELDGGLFEAEGPRVVERCRAALARYRVLEGPDWAEAPEVVALPPQDRQELTREVGELLYLLGRAVLFELARPGRPSWPDASSVAAVVGPFPGVVVLGVAAAGTDNLHAVRKWNALAEGCYPRDEVPRALLLQQGVVAGLGGQQAEADHLLARAAATVTRSPRDAYLSAVEHAALGDFESALPLARDACRSQPGNAGAWLIQGLGRARQGRASDALRSFDVCLALRPDWPAALYHRGAALLSRSEWHAAVADFDAVLEARPKLAQARVLRAEALEALGRYGPAERDLVHAIDDLSGERCELYWRLAAVRRKAGDRAGAARAEADLLRTPPSDAIGWACHARAQQGHDPVAALADYERALELSPSCLDALRGKAELLARRAGGLSAAADLLSKAVDANPGQPLVRLEHAQLLARLGRRGQAVREAEKSLGHDAPMDVLVEAACVYSLTSRQAPEDRRRAVELLTQAARKGCPLSRLERDARLEPLRAEPSYVQLLWALRALEPTGP